MADQIGLQPLYTVEGDTPAVELIPRVEPADGSLRGFLKAASFRGGQAAVWIFLGESTLPVLLFAGTDRPIRLSNRPGVAKVFPGKLIAGNTNNVETDDLRGGPEDLRAVRSINREIKAGNLLVGEDVHNYLNPEGYSCIEMEINVAPPGSQVQVIERRQCTVLWFPTAECSLSMLIRDATQRGEINKLLIPAALFRQTARLFDGLARVNELGILHRDVKPDNILIHEDTFKLSDFGISVRLSKVKGGYERASRGTCGFTPALLWNNQLDEACDVFGAGCTLCCALVSLLEVHLPAMDRHSPCTFWSDTLVKELENGALPRSNLPAGSETFIRLAACIATSMCYENMQVVNLLGEGDNHPSGLKTAHAYELRLPLCDAAKHLDKLADICRETENGDLQESIAAAARLHLQMLREMRLAINSKGEMLHLNEQVAMPDKTIYGAFKQLELCRDPFSMSIMKEVEIILLKRRHERLRSGIQGLATSLGAALAEENIDAAVEQVQQVEGLLDDENSQDTFVVAEGLQILSTLPAADVSAEMPQEEGDLQRVVRYGSGGEELMGLRFTGNTSNVAGLIVSAVYVPPAENQEDAVNDLPEVHSVGQEHDLQETVEVPADVPLLLRRARGGSGGSVAGSPNGTVDFTPVGDAAEGVGGAAEVKLSKRQQKQQARIENERLLELEKKAAEAASRDLRAANRRSIRR